ncbi:hypothetical protein LP414_21640 [Polaromonas sp. P1(28)-13]|nr:hypothetical protein LP414_21640 [Polaromonas sp. P1(28)-13]
MVSGQTFDAFLKLPAPQRKIIHEVILTFVKVHADADAPDAPDERVKN